MLSKSLIELVKCRIREFMREPSAMYWVIFMPIVWMLVLGFAFSHPRPETYGVGWLEGAPIETNPDSNTLKARVLAKIKDSPQIILRQGTTGDLNRLFQRGEISLFVEFKGDRAIYHLDNNNQEALRGESLINNLVQRAAGRSDPVDTQIEEHKAEGGRYVDFLIPGLLGMSIMSTSLFGVGMTLVANRRENLLKRYLATPMRAHEFIASHLIGRLFAFSAEFVAIMLAGFLIFNFKIFGNLFAFLVHAILGTAAFTAIALVLASRTKSIPTISGFNNLVFIPMLMLSGVFFSKNNFPDWLKTISNFLPLTALNDGLRKIALEGQSLNAITFELGVLIVYIIVGSILAKRLFRWY